MSDFLFRSFLSLNNAFEVVKTEKKDIYPCGTQRVLSPGTDTSHRDFFWTFLRILYCLFRGFLGGYKKSYL